MASAFFIEDRSKREAKKESNCEMNQMFIHSRLSLRLSSQWKRNHSRLAFIPASLLRALMCTSFGMLLFFWGGFGFVFCFFCTKAGQALCWWTHGFFKDRDSFLRERESLRSWHWSLSCKSTFLLPLCVCIKSRERVFPFIAKVWEDISLQMVGMGKGTALWLAA